VGAIASTKSWILHKIPADKRFQELKLNRKTLIFIILTYAINERMLRKVAKF
jgi:hypothetical protein